MRLYLDSNVLISFLREEIDSSFNNLYLESERFFSSCKLLGAEIVLSDLFLKEINNIVFLKKEQIFEVFCSFGLSVSFNPNADVEKAEKILKITGLHFADAMHVANALQSGCKAIISWNKKDFEKAATIIPCFSPREFVQSNL